MTLRPDAYPALTGRAKKWRGPRTAGTPVPAGLRVHAARDVGLDVQVLQALMCLNVILSGHGASAVRWTAPNISPPRKGRVGIQPI